MGPLYAAYVAATLGLVLAPGATTAVVVRNTLAGGHGAGVRAAVGAATANSIHATLAGLGLWVLLRRWPVLLEAIRLGGAAYLAWLGVKSLARVWAGRRAIEVRALPAEAGTRRASDRSSLVEGFTINILNPAIISFYLAVVPTFMPPAPPPYYFVVLAATHVLLALACHTGWATAFHVLRPVIVRPRVHMGLELGSAAAMLWLSGRVLGQL